MEATLVRIDEHHPCLHERFPGGCVGGRKVGVAVVDRRVGPWQSPIMAVAVAVAVAVAASARVLGVNVKPKLFEEHAGHTNGSRWKTRIWVMVNGVKKSLEKTVLLKYFYGSPSDPRSKRKRQGDAIRFHNDEFIACSVCGKKRRFFRRTLEQCRLYHDADLTKAEWTCIDYPHNDFNCESKDERTATEMMRGCPADPHCKGCLRCVCFGCSACRFKDCACQTCTDYIRNADLDAPSTSKKARRTSKKAK